MEEPQIWINITFNDYNLIKGKDEFLEELRSKAIVQERTKWYPAACTGFEIETIKVLVNSPILLYVGEVIFSGLIWDAIKSVFHFIFSKIIELKNKNRELEIEKIEFEFNDLSIIIIEDVDTNNTKLLNQLQKLNEYLLIMEKYNIENIRAFTIKNESSWMISYNNGCDECIYSPINQTITNC